jgi:hypothetical protein
MWAEGLSIAHSSISSATASRASRAETLVAEKHGLAALGGGDAILSIWAISSSLSPDAARPTLRGTPLASTATAAAITAG